MFVKYFTLSAILCIIIHTGIINGASIFPTKATDGDQIDLAIKQFQNPNAQPPSLIINKNRPRREADRSTHQAHEQSNSNLQEQQRNRRCGCQVPKPSSEHHLANTNDLETKTNYRCVGPNKPPSHHQANPNNQPNEQPFEETENPYNPQLADPFDRDDEPSEWPANQDNPQLENTFDREPSEWPANQDNPQLENTFDHDDEPLERPATNQNNPQLPIPPVHKPPAHPIKHTKPSFPSHHAGELSSSSSSHLHHNSHEIPTESNDDVTVIDGSVIVDSNPVLHFVSGISGGPAISD